MSSIVAVRLSSFVPQYVSLSPSVRLAAAYLPPARVSLTSIVALLARSVAAVLSSRPYTGTARRSCNILPNLVNSFTVLSGRTPYWLGGQLRMRVALRPTVSRYIWKRRSALFIDSPWCQNQPALVALASLSPGFQNQPSMSPSSRITVSER